MSWLSDLLGRIFGKPPPPAPPPPTPPPTPPRVVTLVQAFNVERARVGLSPLIEDPKLVATAVEWARTMAALGEESHDDFEERLWSVYPGVPIGEVVAEGYQDIPSVMAGWMASPPHRADILGDFDRAGGGAIRSRSGVRYWCGQFCLVGGG